MDKPLTVARQEFMDNTINLINESHLPAFVIVDLFENILPALKEQAFQQYEADLAKYKGGDNNGE